MPRRPKSASYGGICYADCTSPYAYIELTNLEITKVDAEDLPMLRKYTWGVNREGGYVQTGIGKKIVRMHRLLLNAPDGVQVDHINGNLLDNTKGNLRLCTRSQNAGNSGPQTWRHGRPYKGVYAWKKGWKAVCAGKHVGFYKTAEEAAKAYDKAAVERWGEFAKTNLSASTTSPPPAPESYSQTP